MAARGPAYAFNGGRLVERGTDNAFRQGCKSSSPTKRRRHGGGGGLKYCGGACVGGGFAGGGDFVGGGFGHGVCGDVFDDCCVDC